MPSTSLNPNAMLPSSSGCALTPTPSHHLRGFTLQQPSFSSALHSFSLSAGPFPSSWQGAPLYPGGKEGKKQNPSLNSWSLWILPFLCNLNTAKLLDSLASVMLPHFMSHFLSFYSTSLQLLTWSTTACSLKYFLPWHHSCHTDRSVSFLVHPLPNLSM